MAARDFVWKGTRLGDPDPAMSPDEVRAFYAQVYPELTTAIVEPVQEVASGQVHTFAEAPKAAAVAKAGSGSTYQFKSSQGSRG